MSSFSGIRNNTNTRRTCSSPYLGTFRRPQTHYNDFNESATCGTNSFSRNRTEGFTRPSSNFPPPRGSRSAPPNFHTANPDLHEYYERRTGARKEIKRKALESKLEKLMEYQEMIANEIDDLEKDFETVFETRSPGCKRRPRTCAPKTKPAPQSSSKAKLKQFRVVGGGAGNLAYKINKTTDKAGKVRSFSVEVDVKGYIAGKIEVDTDDDTMSVRASKMNGTKRDLKIVAPTVKDMEKAYVHHPRFGLLVIDF